MATPNGATEDAGRRRSGRTIRQPQLFADEYHEINTPVNGSVKRKRANTANQGDQPDDVDDDVESAGTGEESEGEPDEEETRDKRPRRTNAVVAKPATKRPKTTNGVSTTLAIRSANVAGKSASKFARQKARSRPSQFEASGLFAEVFGKGNTAEDAASIWLQTLSKDNVAGIRDLVNFILQCIGCDSRIENADIEDIDNVPTRLGDVLEEYAQQNNTEYPLASKLKQYAGFKEVFNDFSNALVHTLHNSGMLYDEPAVYDNIHIWTATMSGAGYRSFRHTATVISLSMTTALCQVVQELQSSMATTKTQIEAEKKKKSANKARMTALQDEQKRDGKRLEAIDALLRDAFDTVYVHRYRDVDEKIRVECVTALGDWIVLYRKMFLESQYLRYLGWVLSDPNAQTRLEVVKALKALFKNRGNVAALRAFTDKFRPRVVEMGARDTDTSVRVEAIELLDRLRNAELLEPDDIDTIGQFIFDNEPRIRKAVAKFFVSNIEDLYQAIVDDYDQETYQSSLPKAEDEDDFLEPTQSWIKFKCLAQTLVSHDRDNESRRGRGRAHEIYGTEDVESRFMLATQSVFPYMSELEQWESLAGYLLFDHSSISANADDADVSLAVQGAFKLSTGEDMALLDVLHYAVKLSLQQIVEAQAEKKGKKASKAEIQRRQEEAAGNLTLIIPQLLNKFGSTPEAAASILRLEQLLNIDLIADLQSGEATYETIIEQINKQFTSHNDRKVLAEASKAFRTARAYETSKEAADAKVAEIWSDSREALSTMLRNKNLSARGTLDRNVLRQLGDVVGRLAQLAVVSDCTEVLESRMSGSTAKKTKRQSTAGIGQETFLQVLSQIASRGVYDEDTTEEFAELEDRLCGSVISILSLYFRWKVVGLKNAITTKDSNVLTAENLTNLALTRTSFIEALQPIIDTRQPLDQVRVNAILTILDLVTLFATVRHMKPNKGELEDETQSNLQSLVTNMSRELVDLVMETHEKMEKRLASKTKKRIDTPAEDQKKSKTKKRRSGASEDAAEADDDVEKPPEDSEDEAASEDEPEDEEAEESDEETQASGSRGREARKQAALVAEQALCELTSKIVLAAIAAVISDFSGGKIKDRLQVNRSRLGKSYGQVIAYLDEKKDKKKPKRKSEEPKAKDAAVAKTTKDKERQKAKTGLSEPMVIEDDDIEDDEDERREEGDEGDLRERGLDDDPVEDENENEDGEGDAGAGDNVDADDVMGD